MCEEASYEFLGIFRGFISPLIFLFGFIGNCFLIWTFTTKCLQTRFAIYSIFLPFIHNFILIMNTLLDDFFGLGITYIITGSCSSYIVKFDGLSNLFCKLWVFIPELCYATSSWTLVAFTIDRYLTLKFPFKFYSHGCIKQTYYFIILLTVACFLINLPMFVTNGLIPVYNKNKTEIQFYDCTFLSKDFPNLYKIALVIKIMFSFVIPYYLTLILNIFLLLKFLRINARHERLVLTSNEGFEKHRAIGHLCLSSFIVLMVIPLVTVMTIRFIYSYHVQEKTPTLKVLIFYSKLFSSTKDISYGSSFYIYLIFFHNFKWYFLIKLVDFLLNTCMFKNNQKLLRYKTEKIEIHLLPKKTDHTGSIETITEGDAFNEFQSTISTDPYQTEKVIPLGSFEYSSPDVTNSIINRNVDDIFNKYSNLESNTTDRSQSQKKNISQN